MTARRAPLDGFAGAMTWLLSALGTLSALVSTRQDERFPHDPLLDQRTS